MDAASFVRLLVALRTYHEIEAQSNVGNILLMTLRLLSIRAVSSCDVLCIPHGHFTAVKPVDMVLTSLHTHLFALKPHQRTC